MSVEQRWWRWARSRHAWVAVGVVLFAVVAYARWRGGAKGRFERMVGELRARGERVELDDWLEPAIADAENGAVPLRGAIEGVRRETRAWRLVYLGSPALPFTRKEAAAVAECLAENAEVFRLVEEAMTRPRLAWPERPRGGRSAVDVMIGGDAAEAWSRWRDLGNLLQVAAAEAAARGDVATALRRVRQVLLLARCADRRRPCLVQMLVAFGLRDLACRTVEEVLPEMAGDRLSAGSAARREAEALLAELGDEAREREGVVRATKGERSFLIAAVEGFMSRPMPSAELAQFPSAMPVRVVAPLVYDDTVALCGNLVAAGEIFVTSADRDTAVRRAKPLTTFMERQPALHRWGEMMGGDAGDRWMTTCFLSVAHQRATRAALAVACYAADHGGQTPSTLADALRGGALADPMKAGAVLGYAGDGEDPRVWSAGRNGRDEGGRNGPATLMEPTAQWADDVVVHLRRQARHMGDVMQELRDEAGEKKSGD